MKTLLTLVFSVISSFGVFAQNVSPIPHINRQIADYFSYYPKVKVFIATDKQCYKPGETIWFSAMVDNSQASALPSQELTARLYNNKGEVVTGDKFKLNLVNTAGDLEVPDKLPGGQYYLVAYVSTHTDIDEVFCTALNIDPAYSNQWIASVTAKDSISIAGQKNELFILLQTLSGEMEKNTTLRYQILNGNETIEKGKLKTDNAGKAILSFTLPAKSNGEPFICELTDNKEEWKKEIFLPSNLDPVIIKFYPEGGAIVAGVPAKVGFTACNKWGIPINIEGSLVNQEGTPVGKVKTITKGLGLFPLEDNGKQKLKLVLSGKTSQNQTFNLPSPNTDGLAFSVAKTDPEHITVNLVFADKQKHTITLTTIQKGSLLWAADLDINGLGRIKIPTEKLAHGINMISVFSQNEKLLAERLVFVDKKQCLKVEVQPEKITLKQGENMKIKIRLTDENNQPVSGNVSVSIADRSRKNETTRQIEEYLLAGAELETSFCIISEAFQDKITNPALMDIFLIATRQNDFDWKKIVQFKPLNANGNNRNNSISGVVTDKNGNRIKKAKVSLVNNRSLQILTTTTNYDGFFSFPNQNQTNQEDFSVKATDQEGKRTLNVELNRTFEDKIALYIKEISKANNLLNEGSIIAASYFRNNPNLFNKAPKNLVTNTVASNNQQKLLSTSTNLLDVIKTIKPYKIMNNQIVFMGSENSINYQGGALIVLDGQQLGTDISVIQSVSLHEVDHINISTNPIDIQRYTGLNSVGIIEIFLKKAQVPVTSEKRETIGQYNGEYRIPKVFPAESANNKRDIRTTLQWIPELHIDETGQAEISVTAGKVLSDFVIEIQGMGINGRVGSGKAVFSVEK